ncbi:MAG: tetratricopeptide repeat protein [Spirochaetales bacterium]|nr:tetratricopeptide repeat protein [Spirochaetales bacterium]
MKGDFKKAAKLYRRAKYPQVIRLLEPQIFRYRQNYGYFYLVGMSCLNTGDLGGASTYLQRGLGLKPNDANACLGLALVHLKRQEIQEAIRCYLEVLESDPGNKIAARGLTLLQKDASVTGIQQLKDSGRLSRLMPDRRRGAARAAFLIVTFALILTGAFVTLWYTGALDATEVIREPSVEMISIENIGNLVDFSGEYRYLLTEKEIRDSFIAAKKHFSNFDDNLAQREINRLLGSNATITVKEQVRLIAGYIPKPNFTTVKHRFDYQVVAADPFLYSDTYVVWSGKLTNLAVSDEKISFDLLVGYEKNQLLLGVVPVVLRFAASLNIGDAVEVLGKVKVTENEGFYLEVVSLHKLQTRETT